MSIFEYDKEKEEKKLRKAEYDAGWDKGWQEGQNFGWDKGWKDGQSKGLLQGIQEIITMGREFGLSDDTLIKRLQDKFDMNETEAAESVKQSRSAIQ